MLQITLLILSLESNHFAIREEASRKLSQYGSMAVPQLQTALTATRNAEVRQRCKLLIDAQRPAQVAELLTDLPPWLDALPFDYPNRCVLLSDYLCREDVQRDSREQKGTYATYRAATRAWVIDQVYAGTPMNELRELLKLMQSRHPLWGRDADQGWNGWADDPNRPPDPEPIPPPRML